MNINSTIGGLRWKCLNDKTNILTDTAGRKTFQYVTDNYSLTITDEDVIHTLKYKCVLIQESISVIGNIILIKPITFKVYKEDGTELTEAEYHYCHYTWAFPINSMLKLVGYTNDQIAAFSHDDNYYYISGDGTLPLNYTILNTFNKKKRDNSVAIQIDFGGNTLFTSTSFKFLKDGQSGNNGIKYSGIITYNGYCYGEQDTQGKIRKLQFVYINGSNTWYQYDITNERLISFNRPELKVEIYADGDKVTDSSKYNVVGIV